MTRKTVWHAIAESLAAEGVEYVFGLPGNPRHLIYDLTERTGVKFVLVRHEHSAVACAYAYARLSRRPGVVFSNPGPGITNLATGLLEATCGSLPVVAISNGVVLAHDGRGAFQELDSVALLRPVTKWATRIVDPKTTHWTMRRAFARAQNGRPGAVHVEVPSDFADVVIETGEYTPSPPRLRSRPAQDGVAQAALMLAQAQQPLLLCGSGAVWSEAGAEVHELARAVGMPVFTTPGGRGVISEDDPLALGQVGLYFTRAGKAYYDGADLIVSVGSRLEASSTSSWAAFPRGAKLIQIDIEADAIGLNWQPDAALLGDAALALADLRLALPPLDRVSREQRLKRLSEQREGFLAEIAAEGAEMTTPIRVPQVLAAVSRVFGRNTVLCKENGGADLWCYYWPYYRVSDLDCCVPMAEQTAMGMGVIGTIGAKLARPDRNVVCISGDGAMNMAMMELATAAEQKCGVTWVVLNNRALGWVQYNQLLNQKPFIATNFDVSADFAAIAEAQGCRGLRVTAPDQVEPALIEALRANADGIPALLDIAIRKHDYPSHFVDVHRARLEH